MADLGFNRATAFQPWRADRAGAGQVGENERFNGATAFQPWRGFSFGSFPDVDQASMGPRLFSRGELVAHEVRKRVARGRGRGGRVGKRHGCGTVLCVRFLLYSIFKEL